MAPTYPLFLIALFYALFLLVLSLTFLNKKILRVKHPKLFLFFLALLIRFIPAFFFPFGSKYDISAFRWAADQIRTQTDIYQNLNFRHQYAFFPAFALLLNDLLKINSPIGLPFLFIEKLPVIFFDSLIAALIFKISKELKYGFVYALSPIGVIIGAYIGQFDSIPLFFCLLSLYLFKLNRRISSFLTLGLATIFKPWPVILFPLLWFRSKSILTIFSFVLPILLIISFYSQVIQQPNILFMLIGIVIYDSAGGWWGLSLLFKNYFLHQLSKIIVIAFTVVSAKYLNKENVFTVVKIIFLIIYTFSFGLSIHYFLWIFPFTLLTKDSFTKYYLLNVSGYLILFAVFGGFNYNFKPPETPSILYSLLSFFLWCFFSVWLFKETRNLLRNYILK